MLTYITIKLQNKLSRKKFLQVYSSNEQVLSHKPKYVWKRSLCFQLLDNSLLYPHNEEIIHKAQSEQENTVSLEFKPKGLILLILEAQLQIFITKEHHKLRINHYTRCQHSIERHNLKRKKEMEIGYIVVIYFLC